MKMNKQPSRNLDGLDLDLNRKIDAICRRFESDRRDGRQAPVDEYLPDILDEGRAALRAELESVEHELGRSDDTVARPETGLATASHSSTISEAPTITPEAPVTDAIAGEAPSSVHQETTLPPRDGEAIDYAHQCGVIHRDLKPGNILLDLKGNPRVTDFGLAKRIQGDSGLTGSGQIMGTPSYMPPEQAGGKRGAVGPAADVYALGATLYCVVTGRPPFQAATAMDTVIQVLSDEPVPPRRLNASIPRDLETICLKCLEKEPDQRYASASALAADLRRFLTGGPIAARPVTPIEPAAKWARRKPTLAAAYTLGLLAVLLGGLGGTAVWQWRAAERARGAAKFAQAEAERQRDRADAARSVADTGRVAEQKARIAEQKARAEAERQRERFERFDYGRTMQVAHEEWRENNVPATVALLESTRSDLRGWEWQYVHRLCHTDLLTLMGHTSAVLSASFSPDGSRVVTGSYDSTANVWGAHSGAEVLTLKGHTDWVHSVSFSPDGLRIGTGSRDHTAKVWDAKNGAEIRTLKGHTVVVNSVAFSRDGSMVLTGSADKTDSEEALAPSPRTDESSQWP